MPIVFLSMVGFFRGGGGFIVCILFSLQFHLTVVSPLALYRPSNQPKTLPYFVQTRITHGIIVDKNRKVMYFWKW